MVQEELRVLMVDDNSAFCEIVAKFLHDDYSYQVDTATDAEHAWALVTEAEALYHVVLLDDMLVPVAGEPPTSMGVELMSKIKKHSPQTEIIIITAMGMHHALDAMKAGAFRYLTKPVNLNELAIIVRLAAEYRELKSTAHRAEDLEALRQTSLAITSTLDRHALLNMIIEQAVKLLRAKGGGIYEYFPERGELVVIADYNRSDYLGTILAVGEGMAGHLVQTGDSFILVDDYSQSPQRAHVYDRHPFGAVLEVPLKWQDRIIGVLYIHDEVGQKFTSEDAMLLRLFADQAAIALTNAMLMASDEAKLHRLEKLSRATKEIMGNLGLMTLDECLSLIAKHAAEILEAEVSGVLLVDGQGFLSLEASHGHIEEGFHKGRKFAIRSGPRSGLTGHIAHEGKLFNAHGDDLANHFAVQNGTASHLPSGKCHSLLAIPLNQKVEREEKLVGLLRVDNKKNAEGQALPALGFDKEDEWILRIFAEAVVVAIESAELVDELKKRQNHWERLVASSPMGIIAIDAKGSVTGFNKQAEEILAYSAHEVLGTHVAGLYWDPQEPHKIGKKLHVSPDGKLENHETHVKSSIGEKIPIRHSSIWLYDAKGGRAGSVGYFEDLRSIKETEKRLELLLKASTVVVQAKNLKDGLNRLIDMVASLLPHTFCRILIMDESEESLLAEAISPAGRSHNGHNFQAGLKLNEWPGLKKRLKNGAQIVLRRGHHQDQAILKKLAHHLHLQEGIESLLVVPLKLEDKVVGLLEVGEVRSETLRPFTDDELGFAAAIAEKMTILIDLMRLHDLTARREQLLDALFENSRYMRGDKDPRRLLPEFVRLAVKLVECTAGGLYINPPHSKEWELITTYTPGRNKYLREILNTRIPHLQGLVGLVAKTGEPQVIAHYDEWPDRDPALESQHYQTVVGIPLKQAGQVNAVLFVADQTGQKKFMKADLEILERFAAQASVALQMARTLNREQRVYDQLSVLHTISDYIQQAEDLNKILHVVLTGITAVYGLCFNRAVVLDLDEHRKMLVGRMGIGQFTKPEADAAWEYDHKHGLDNFETFIKYQENNKPPQTPVGKIACEMRFSLEPASQDAFARAVREGDPILLTKEQLHQLPGDFLNTLNPDSEVIVVPLKARNQVIGLLVADNKFTLAPITDEITDLLVTFANTAAIAITNARLMHETKVARDKLQASFAASNDLISAQKPDQVLEEIVERAPIAADAAWVRVFLIDKMGRPQKQILAGTNKKFDVPGAIRPEGISVEVMRTGQAVVIEDTYEQRHRVNPFILENHIAAAVCLPLSVRGKPFGVIWINYEQPRQFLKFEIDALQLYANQSAIAYDNARRMQESEHLHEAAQKMSNAVGLHRVQHTIVEVTRSIFGADSATLWPYDDARKKFIPEELVAVGISKMELKIFREIEPEPQGITYTVLKEGWVGVEDIDDPKYGFLRKDMQDLLRRSNIHSFQGITLKVGEEPVGILYVSYKQPHGFGEESRPFLENFARHAALSLKNARLLDQVENANRAASVVARVTALGSSRKETLDSVAQGMLDSVGCDAVTLYVYDSKTGKIDNPPTIVGVTNPQGVMRSIDVDANSLVCHLLKRDEPYEVEEIENDELFKNSRFAQEEEIASCVAIPLKVGAQKVGVMFVNFRTRHRFTAGDINSIQLFANQAAVAIHNTQLFEEQVRKLKEQQSLVRLSQELAGARSVKETIDGAVTVAADVLGTEFCDIVLADDDGTLIIRAAIGWEKDLVGTYQLKGGEKSHTGYTLLTQAPVVVDDYDKEERFVVPEIVFEHHIKSGMSVPILRGDQAIGAMLVHTLHRRHFNESEVYLLSLIAFQTSIAIRSAERHEAIEKQKSHLEALYKACKTITESFASEQKVILGSIVQQAVQCIVSSRGLRTILGTIQLHDEATNELVLISASPPEAFAGLVEKMGEKRSIDKHHQPEWRIGIGGRTVEEKKEQLVCDVTVDKDYIQFNERTLSEMAAPLIDNGKVLGVLDLESDQFGAFDQNDLNTLKALADLAVIVIQIARRFEELKELRVYVGSHTVLNWMKMVRDAWAHNIRNQVGVARSHIWLVGEKLSKGKVDEAFKALDQVKQDLKAIAETPIIKPLSSQDAIDLIQINDFVKQHFELQWENDDYKLVDLTLKLEPGLDNRAGVRASSYWLRNVLDIIVDNAVRAMRETDGCNKQLTVTTQLDGESVKISIEDTGPGIPESILKKIFKHKITEEEGSKGAGVGLMIANNIIQTYEGRIDIKQTSGEGTSLIIVLPNRA